MKGSQAYFAGCAAGRLERNGVGMRKCPHDPNSPQGRDWMAGWWDISTGARDHAIRCSASGVGATGAANDNRLRTFVPVRAKAYGLIGKRGLCKADPADRDDEFFEALTKTQTWYFLEDETLIRALRTEPRPDAARLARELKRTKGQVLARLAFLRATRFPQRQRRYG